MIDGLKRLLRALATARHLLSLRVTAYRRWRRRWSLRLQAFREHGQVEIGGVAMLEHPVRFQGHGRLVIEDGVTFGFRLAGLPTSPILLQPREKHATIHIGSGSAIMNGCEFKARRSIRIGPRCLIGPGTTIMDADFHGLAPDKRMTPGKTAEIVIEQNVWIGSRATILKGVRIGQDAVIAASSVVTKDVLAGAIAAGNPARVVGTVYHAPDEPPTGALLDRPSLDLAPSSARSTDD